MLASLKRELMTDMRKIIRLNSVDTRNLVDSFNSTFHKITKIIFAHFKEEIKPIKTTISLGSVDPAFSVSYGVNRNKNEIIIADWIFELPKMIKGYILYFIIVKESILYYLNPEFLYELRETEEAIVNIITILLLAEVFESSSLDSPLIASITARIHSTEISGRNAHYWVNLLHLLIAKKISFSEVINAIKGVFDKPFEKQPEAELVKGFSSWIFENAVREEDVISPIYLSNRLIDTVDNLLEFGYVIGTAPNIADKMNLHENTVRNQIQFLSENYATFWRPEINLEKINLHNYFLKIKIKDSKSFDKINQIITEIPYIKTLFHGKYSDEQIIYTPTLICPHIVANGLDARLTDFKNKKLIEDYTLQITREKKHFATITSYPLKPDKKTFQQLIDGKYEPYLRNYLFTHSKKEFSMVIEDDVPIDYNLLFFLAILRMKYMLRSRVGVWVNELPKLYQLNDISSADVAKQTDFLNQIEIRARKRGFLAYCFFIRSLTRRGSDILVTEIQDIDDYPEKFIKETIEKLRIFSFLGQITLYDRIILTMPGVSYHHYIKDIMATTLDQVGIKSTFYTIGLQQSKFIPFHDLFDFDEQKWKA